MHPRFYVPEMDAAATHVALPADEAAHLVKVLRLGMGSEVDIFDGRGGLWRAEVVRLDKRVVVVRRGEPGTPAPETRVRIRLVASVLKADKMDGVVRDAVMLGVAAIQPVVSARSEIGHAALVRSRRVARWQRIAVASAKQCGRAVVPIVHEPVSFNSYLAGPRPGIRVMCIEPSAGQPQAVRGSDIPAPVAADVIIGPEGGWTPDEVSAALAAGVAPVSLGGRTLRADAAPLVALTVFFTRWGELS